ncbi:M18 family aminopeptidase [Rhodocyclus tenuis]|uniref:M18 family aminopeptidase n=1 Tax=Rhodocyclus gracilis TaxID=2929842 RepID=UPI0012988EAA|nr:M18 family aminopeptidase [Rhodocyclus gracilis]MRD72335.1 M18 family aminopeptidase [Rhodocyclus gracilis]
MSSTPTSLIDTAHATARTLLDFIDASPSPWHAVARTEEDLRAHGFTPLDETQRWQLSAGGRYYVVRGGSSIIAFVIGTRPLLESGLRIVSAHTDSPGLRLKPHAAHVADGLLRLGVEVYGGPILATFTDRDLSLAGRVVVRGATGPSLRRVRFEQALLRLPNLAIHMNRDVNEHGLKLNRQNELPLLLALAAGNDAQSPDERLRQLLADAIACEQRDILSWELAVHDVQAGAFWGADKAFIASRQLDNLASCHAALAALVATPDPDATCIAAFFDHEEVGSESATGAGGSFIGDVLARIAGQAGLDAEDRQRCLSRSFFISADMAHAYHPSFPSAYEPAHKAMVNAGPVIKSNANQRYATNAETAARFILLCERAGVPYQQYAHRSDLSCGSTIGPTLAAQLGISCVDVGAPLWAMHSIRESAGVLDHTYMIQALSAHFAS